MYNHPAGGEPAAYNPGLQQQNRVPDLHATIEWVMYWYKICITNQSRPIYRHLFGLYLHRILYHSQYIKRPILYFVSLTIQNEANKIGSKMKGRAENFVVSRLLNPLLWVCTLIEGDRCSNYNMTSAASQYWYQLDLHCVINQPSLLAMIKRFIRSCLYFTSERVNQRKQLC